MQPHNAVSCPSEWCILMPIDQLFAKKVRRALQFEFYHTLSIDAALALHISYYFLLFVHVGDR